MYLGSEIVSVRSFGAIGDGIANDRIALQKAIDSGARVVHLPAGIYRICGDRKASLDGVNITRSDLSLVGDGQRHSLILQDESSMYGMAVNRYKGGGSDHKGNATNLRFRDIGFRGACDTAGFAEHDFLLNLNAVTDVDVDHCSFVGFRGDGIYVGSGNLNGIERHNHRVTIRNCLFDGINRNNRNAISVIDCDDLLVERNSFLRCSRKGMPGPVDIEPNRNDFHAIRAIRVLHNRFSNCGGNGVLCVNIPLGSYKTNHYGFDFSGNHVTDCPDSSGIWFLHNENSSYSRDHAAIFDRNVFENVGRMFSLMGASNLTISHCSGSRLARPSRIGSRLPHYEGCQNVNLEGLNFSLADEEYESTCCAIEVGSVRHLQASQNTVKFMGAKPITGQYAYHFIDKGSSQDVSLIGNQIMSSGHDRPSLVMVSDRHHSKRGSNQSIGNRLTFAGASELMPAGAF